MKSLLCFASVGLLVLLCAACGEGKAFQLAVKDDSILCATSTVSQTTSVSDLRVQLNTNRYLPPPVVCVHRCITRGPCHSFNYRSDTNSCDFYDHPPTACQPQPNCHYYKVRNVVIISFSNNHCEHFDQQHRKILHMSHKSVFEYQQ